MESGPFPTELVFEGAAAGIVTVGTNSLHDGALQVGNFGINYLEDLFFPDAGIYNLFAPISTTIPVNNDGTFSVDMQLASESWGRIGLTEGNFFNTVELTSILLPNGLTPESEGWELTFDDGTLSPNVVPIPAALPLFSVGVVFLGFMARRRTKM